ncbi:UDP-N-acetylglucosamine--dolichyl-phosphate N-acetylglucosaminephosphotransferase-like [Paramacrobiotus metropolitanus]|uniref:UDP-N-acetylglucosamine--dolichyl-phosphate N-acetylglucosaminephosphotransferase-like n=1 Tax=Paramacrobiotus metropolitanus TaxID=2943436 RepID=UPI002445C6BE|nr:UDP-N-acetylglucosamine--dolichyl-phosphate N-acetylglucosaminephosphotransferase-like [Paramacrobiotus metropolitanus]
MDNHSVTVDMGSVGSAQSVRDDIPTTQVISPGSLWPLLCNALFSLVAYYATFKIIPKVKEMFVSAGFAGVDMSKKDRHKVPEAMGVVSGAIFLITMFLFIPVPFAWNLASVSHNDVVFANQSVRVHADSVFPHSEFVEFITAILCICCMLFLGFADDALNLRWRDKLFLPTIATLPLLMVYYVNCNSTTIIVPKPLRELVGYSINLGLLYYVFMGMLAVFCTNAINILAGINGLEAGQSFIIAVSVAVFNIIELRGIYHEAYTFSLYFILPYIATTGALLRHNWYPSQVFVGDTFCYFSGMTFAVVAVLGHFSKTMLLFFIPQIFNFLYSVPQLFRFIPCPRHRLPRYSPETDTVSISTTTFKPAQLSFLGRLMYHVFRMFRVIRIVKEEDGMVECNNFTLINLALLVFGPTHERTLTKRLLILQIVCSCLALCIRYPGASLFYDVGN